LKANLTGFHGSFASPFQACRAGLHFTAEASHEVALSLHKMLIGPAWLRAFPELSAQHRLTKIVSSLEREFGQPSEGILLYH